jgi:hypothetical protein
MDVVDGEIQDATGRHRRRVGPLDEQPHAAQVEEGEVAEGRQVIEPDDVAIERDRSIHVGARHRHLPQSPHRSVPTHDSIVAQTGNRCLDRATGGAIEAPERRVDAPAGDLDDERRGVTGERVFAR